MNGWIDDAIRPKAFSLCNALSIQSGQLISLIQMPKTHNMGHERQQVENRAMRRGVLGDTAVSNENLECLGFFPDAGRSCFWAARRESRPERMHWTWACYADCLGVDGQ